MSVVRQFIEPRIVGNHIGIHPIFTLIAMYTGFKVSGVIGLFIGPIALIILKNIFSNLLDKGVVKSIFSRDYHKSNKSFIVCTIRRTILMRRIERCMS